MGAGTPKPKSHKSTRTNVVLDDDLVREAMELTGIKTKRELVEEALKALVMLRKQDQIWDLFGTVEWEGDLDEMRRNRSFIDADR